ncbi:LacI family DNA-binding transcriptional regulator [Oleiharenicola lentus]|uniref:LacI family DNA-binding transcriptional regulator n=1 Tax=Oleiharenicola lentus TaxID=2508720 RepID=UPI003F661559
MASQNEIAHLANVSQSVVSRVLNGRAAQFGIATETAARITAIAAQLGYRPHPAATMLLGGASKLVGVVVRSFDDPFLAAILQELNRRALASGHTLLVIGLEGDERQRTEEVRLMQRYRPDALIVVGSTDFSAWSDDLFTPGKTVVQIGLASADPRVITCGIDETAAAAALVQHFHDAGHRHFALIGDFTAASHARVSLLRATLHELAATETHVSEFLSPREGTEAGTDGAQFLLANDAATRATAAIATGDSIALGLLHTLAQHAIAVPETIAVASYDDVPMAVLMRPALTTIRQPARDLAATAMAIVTGDAPRAPVLLRGELIVRESSRR